MPRVYLDNAATSWPKPEAVYAAVDRYQREWGTPAGRSAYAEAAEVERRLGEVRRLAAGTIGAEDPRRIVFTCNGTDSLNQAIHGWLRAGDHVVTTCVEHNSVLRPLRTLERSRQISVTRVPCGADGVIDPNAIRQAVTPRTRLIALNHVSNVTGAIQPAAEVGTIAREHEIPYLLDAAQSLGHLPIDVRQWHVSLLAAPGHKGLLGPLGTGVLYVAPGMESHLLPCRQGGTGTQSELDEQPETLPDRYESGNHNVPGLIGLGAGLAYIQQRGLDDLRRHQSELVQRLIEGLREVRGIQLWGPGDAARQCGVVSLTIDGYDPQEVASMLDVSYRIQVRSGLHCAPLMHTALGTRVRGGTVRFSVGPFNTQDEVALAVTACAEIADSSSG
ncbi:MAG: aminotransferase class V-fold PLP-dependent enzyme [Pirellulaceae bacterium]